MWKILIYAVLGIILFMIFWKGKIIENYATIAPKILSDVDLKQNALNYQKTNPNTFIGWNKYIGTWLPEINDTLMYVIKRLNTLNDYKPFRLQIITPTSRQLILMDYNADTNTLFGDLPNNKIILMTRNESTGLLGVTIKENTRNISLLVNDSWLDALTGVKTYHIVIPIRNNNYLGSWKSIDGKLNISYDERYGIYLLELYVNDNKEVMYAELINDQLVVPNKFQFSLNNHVIIQYNNQKKVIRQFTQV